MRGRWSLLALVVLVMACAGLAQTSRGHALLRDMGLYEEPASYTELAFTSPDALPYRLKSAKEPVGVSFSVRNVSGSPRSYQWSIAEVHDGKSQVRATGTVAVPAQAGATVTRSVATACATGRLQVVVSLASPAQSIDFWVACPAAGPAPKATHTAKGGA